MKTIKTIISPRLAWKFRKELRQAILCSVAMSAVVSAIAAPPPGSEEVDQEVSIVASAGTMTFDINQFIVKPGSLVKLVLTNEDGMPHNLVICEPGENVTDRVGDAVLALGGEAMEKEFIPDLPEVLFHTGLVDPGKSDAIIFRAPDQEGAYPYVCTMPGHWFTMKGTMQVSEGPPGFLHDLTFSYFPGRFDSVHELGREAPSHSGPVPGAKFDIEEHAPELGEMFGLIFAGKLNLAQGGEYTFRVASDDGVRLAIGGEEVVIDDGHHGATERVGKIHLSRGLHPIELRYFESGGGRMLKVSLSGPGLADTPLSPVSEEGRSRPEDFLVVGDQPRVMRLLMPDASTDAIAVGLRESVSYCFDVTDSSVRYGWWGGFLDVGPHMLGRGGKPARIQGKRFEVGYVPYPLRVGNNDEPEVKFLGYRRGKHPQFMYTVDGIPVTQTIESAPQFSGLIYHFQLEGSIPAPVRFLVEPENLLLSSSAGEWDGGVLTVPASEARAFQITIQAAINRPHRH